jgi:hypothetical protein
MKFSFSLQEIEETGMDVASFLIKNTDLLSRIEKISNNTSAVKQIKCNLDLNVLEDEIRNKFSIYGWYGFLVANFMESESDRRTTHYGGLGITFNPFHWQHCENPHLQVLGDRRFNLGSIFRGDRGYWRWEQLILRDLKNQFYSICEKKGVKAGCEFLLSHDLMVEDEVHEAESDPRAHRQRGVHTYSDSLSFNQLTPAASDGYLGELLKKQTRTVVRSRLVELKSKASAEVHWHTDENIFLCTRINIPIWSNLDQTLHTLEGQHPLEVGDCYSWNTGKPHKVTVEGEGSRTNLVLGISPWFDYSHKEKKWSSNEYYGEIHPHEMFQKGILFSQ